MFPELYALAMALSFLVGGATLDSDNYRKALESLRRAIQKHGQQKASMPADPGHLSRMLHGQARLPFDVIADADVEIQRSFHFEELQRLGLPSDVRAGLKMARMLLKGQEAEKRSA